LRKKSGQSATKKYLYADFLQFLLKVTEKDETESSILGESMTESTETQVEEETAVQEMDEASSSSRDAGTLQHRRRKASQVDEIDRKILKSLEKIEPDEDEAFFISILPSVRQLSADDKLDFRMVVLKAIKDIKTRNISTSPQTTATPTPTQTLSNLD
jgi:hypothetical protein